MSVWGLAAYKSYITTYVKQNVLKQKPEPCAAENKTNVETILKGAVGTMTMKAGSMYFLAVAERTYSPPAYLHLQKRYVALATDEEEQISEWKQRCQLRLKQVSAPNTVVYDSDWRLYVLQGMGATVC